MCGLVNDKVCAVGHPRQSSIKFRIKLHAHMYRRMHAYLPRDEQPELLQPRGALLSLGAPLLALQGGEEQILLCIACMCDGGCRSAERSR